MRHYHFEKIENFRDLGGYECNYGETSYGVIFRSATLAFATKNDIEKLANLGLKTVLDIRGPRPQEQNPNPLKGDSRFQVIEMDVNGSGRIPVDYDDGIASYLEMLEEPASARNILRVILNAPKPMVIHCNAGKDRTGVFCILLMLLAGVHKDDINADYMLSFPCLRLMTHETRAHHPEVSEHCLTPNIEYLFDFFDAFEERYGTVEEYLENIGLEEDEIAGLANLLGKQEKSCGAVVFHDGKILVEHMKAGHYSLPKGHVEEIDKDDFDTARREIREELGLEIDFMDGFQKDVVYSPKPGTIKRVIFFAATSKQNEVKCQEEEVQEAYWLEIDDAIRCLTHNSDRQIAYEAGVFYLKSTK